MTLFFYNNRIITLDGFKGVDKEMQKNRNMTHGWGIMKSHAANNHMPLEIEQVWIKMVTPLWLLLTLVLKLQLISIDSFNVHAWYSSKSSLIKGPYAMHRNSQYITVEVVIKVNNCPSHNNSLYFMHSSTIEGWVTNEHKKPRSVFLGEVALKR